MTPLSKASADGRDAMVEFLIKHGAAIEHKNNEVSWWSCISSSIFCMSTRAVLFSVLELSGLELNKRLNTMVM